jgi:hypothetical protein
MSDVASFLYTAVKNARGEIALRPLLSLTLTYGGTTVEATGLHDTGADVDVLPYHLGITLGGKWRRLVQDCSFPAILPGMKHAVFSSQLLSDSLLQCSLPLPGRTCRCCSGRLISSLISTCASYAHAMYLKFARNL